MDRDHTLAVKTVRHSEYADEYEGREGLMKLPYKMLLQQSEIHNGQLQSDIDELRDKIDILNARIAELEAENKDLKKGLLKEYSKEVKREELYSTQKKNMEHMNKSIAALRQNNRDLLNRILWLQNHPKDQEPDK
jgi:cell division protein FtsB